MQSRQQSSLVARDLLALVTERTNLEAAWRHVKANHSGPGIDGVTLDTFSHDLPERLQQIAQQLQQGVYRFEPNMSVKLSHTQRLVAILTVSDRLVCQAVAQVLTPLLESCFHQASYAYRPGRNAIQAAEDLLRALRRHPAPHVLRCDIHNFFDHVDHDILLQFLDWVLPEQPLLMRLMTQILQQPSLRHGQVQATQRGLCQGSPLSPLLSNLYLTPLDRYLAQSGWQHFRFCDDIAIVLPTAQQAPALQQALEDFLHDYLHLGLHPQKQACLPFEQGFDFLGFHLSPQGRRPSSAACQRLQQRLAQDPDDTSRQQTVQRWSAYFGPLSGSALEAATATANAPASVAPAGARANCAIQPAAASTAQGPSTPSNAPASAKSTAPDSPTDPAAANVKHAQRAPDASPAASAAPTSPAAGSAYPPIISLLQELFQGHPHCFARAYTTPKRYGYTPVKRPLQAPDLIAHLRGSQTLGIYLMHNDNVRCTCLDLDLDQQILQAARSHPAQYTTFQGRLWQYVRQLQDLLRSQTPCQPLLEQSGYKGYHLWLFFQTWVPASQVVEFWRQLLQASPPPAKIHAEIFPRSGHTHGGLGPLVKLPLGRHPFSQQRAMFLDDSGNMIANPLQLLSQVPRLTPAELTSCLHKSLLSSENQSDPVQRLLAGCEVCRALCAKARREKHLGHFERLILLYTIGQLGSAGAHYLHQVFRHCHNYDRHYTQRQLEKKHPSPMGCRRIQEIMGAALENINCRCQFELPARGYRSPLLHVYPQATKNLGRAIP